MPFIISGPSGNQLRVDEDLRGWVALGYDPETAAQSGSIAAVAVPDRGQFTGTIEARDFDINQDFATRVAVDQPVFQDNFVGTAINSNLYAVNNSTMTAAVANGFLTLNSGGSTTSGHYVNITSYKPHAIYSSATLYGQFRVRTSGAGELNKVIEFGLALASGSSAITDGAVFRLAADGKLYGVIVNNSVESTVSLGSGDPQADDETHLYYIEMTFESVGFWIDDLLYGRIDAPLNWDSTIRAGAVPSLMRQINSGTVASAVKADIAEHQVIQGGMVMGLSLGAALARMGQHALQGQTGFSTLGQQANFANSAAPSLGTLSNTTPAYSTLGGLFRFDMVAGAETDYALFGFQVPAGSVSLSGRQLMVSGLRIDSVNGTAINSTPVVLQWGLGIGSTAASLATTDAANAKGPRRIGLGYQTWAAAAALGIVPAAIDMDFREPLPINAGEYLHVIVRLISASTAVSTPQIRGTVTIRGYWE